MWCFSGQWVLYHRGKKVIVHLITTADIADASIPSTYLEPIPISGSLQPSNKKKLLSCVTHRTQQGHCLSSQCLTRYFHPCLA